MCFIENVGLVCLLDPIFSCGSVELQGKNINRSLTEREYTGAENAMKRTAHPWRLLALPIYVIMQPN